MSSLVPSSVRDTADGGGAPVTAVVTIKESDLRPAIPGWFRTRQGRRTAARRCAVVARHRAAFHGVRSPLYAVLLAWYALRGAALCLWWVCRWCVDARSDALEQQLASGSRDDAAAFVKLRNDRTERVKTRLTVAGLLVVVTMAAAGLLIRRGPAWSWWLVGVVLVVVLVRVGTPAGSGVLAPAMLTHTKYRELTDVIVMRALRAAGLGGTPAKYDRDGNELAADTRPTLAAPISRSSNQRGYEVVVDLPYGKTAGDAAENVQRLASGLDVEEGQVFVTPVSGSTRRTRIYIADEDPMLLKPNRSPLSDLPKVSVWDAQPMATTPVGETVACSLLFSSFLLGAVPRSGKSFAAKVLVAPAVLDPHCDVTVLDLGGGRDWMATEHVAVNYLSGDEDDDLTRALSILEGLRSEARARLASFRDLDNRDCPEDKLTRELSARGMRPHIIVVDELQNILKAPDRKVRKAALDVLTWLAKTAPKAGYSLIAITQRPAAEVIPADFRDITTVRIALRTKTPQGSDAILGAYMSSKGYRSDRFLEEHKGACVIGGISTGAGGDLQYARTDLLMPKDFERACLAGRQRRVDAGTLRGQAAGELPEVTITVTVLADVAAVWPGDTAKVQARVLVDRMREVFADRYAALTPEALTDALRPLGVTRLDQVWDKTTRSNSVGYALQDVSAVRRAIEAD